jgi:hypothetical protein
MRDRRDVDAERAGRLGDERRVIVQAVRRKSYLEIADQGTATAITGRPSARDRAALR